MSMDVPSHLLDGLKADELEVVRAWWLKLPETKQSELTALCDRRHDESFFEPSDSEAGDVPDVVGGRFAPGEDTRGWKTWRAELFDYLVCHPEFAEPQVIRIFHIGCARHLSWVGMGEAMIARLALSCPLGSEACPIQSLVKQRTSPCRCNDECQGPST
jgi:hypothetical protein